MLFHQVERSYSWKRFIKLAKVYQQTVTAAHIMFSEFPKKLPNSFRFLVLEFTEHLFLLVHK